MIIDIHAHVTAPQELYAYKAGILAHRGAHGRGAVKVSDALLKQTLESPVFGGGSHLEQLQEVGTDMQLISPRPYTMMHSEKPEKLVRWFIEENEQHHRQGVRALSRNLPRRVRLAAEYRSPSGALAR